MRASRWTPAHNYALFPGALLPQINTNQPQNIKQQVRVVRGKNSSSSSKVKPSPSHEGLGYRG